MANESDSHSDSEMLVFLLYAAVVEIFSAAPPDALFYPSSSITQVQIAPIVSAVLSMLLQRPDGHSSAHYTRAINYRWSLQPDVP